MRNHNSKQPMGSRDEKEEWLSDSPMIINHSELSLNSFTRRSEHSSLSLSYLSLSHHVVWNMSYGALTAVILITREFLLHELGERGILHKQVKDGRQAKKK